MKPLFTYLAAGKIYIFITTAISIFIAGYSDFIHTLYGFLIISSLDTLSAIHAGAIAKGLKFNPLKAYFWKEIKSALIREWMKKMFSEYAFYLILAFVIETFIIQQKLQLQLINWKLDLPTSCLWVFSAIELWSIGENIERAGGINLIKKGMVVLERVVPEWLRNLIRKK